MAARAICLLPLLLLVGTLSHLAVSASEKQLKVTILVHQHLESPGELQIMESPYGKFHTRSFQLTRGDVWVLTLRLRKGQPFYYYLLLLPDGNLRPYSCKPINMHVITVPEDYEFSHYVEVVSDYDCEQAIF